MQIADQLFERLANNDPFRKKYESDILVEVEKQGLRVYENHASETVIIYEFEDESLLTRWINSKGHNKYHCGDASADPFL